VAVGKKRKKNRDVEIFWLNMNLKLAGYRSKFLKHT
jgi:hypothetical protein